MKNILFRPTLLGILLLLSLTFYSKGTHVLAQRHSKLAEVEPDEVEYQDEPVRVTCQLSNYERDVVMEVENISENTIYIFDDPRMPYRILSDGKLMVVQAAHPPIDDHKVIEFTPALPIRPIQPGETVEHTISIYPLSLSTQYEDYGYIYLLGQFPIQCWVGWLDEVPDEPFYTEENSGLVGFTTDVMVDWQKPLVPSEIIEVDFRGSIYNWMD